MVGRNRRGNATKIMAIAAKRIDGGKEHVGLVDFYAAVAEHGAHHPQLQRRRVG